jgi:hypothetical protein
MSAYGPHRHDPPWQKAGPRSCYPSRRRGHRRGEVAVTCCTPRLAWLAVPVPGCQRRKPASAMANAVSSRCAQANGMHGGTGDKHEHR